MKLKDILQKAKGGIEKLETIKSELNSFSDINSRKAKPSKFEEVDTAEQDLRDNFEENQKKANNQWIMIGVGVVVVVLVLFRKKLKF